MNDREQKAEEAARAMGWRFNDYGTHTNWTRPCGDGVHRMGDPDLDDWRFVGAMIEWLWARDLMSHDVLSDAIVDEYDDEGVRMESPFKWGRFLAIAVIAQAKREAKR